MRPGDGGVAAAVTKMNVLPLFSRAEQLPFKIPVRVPASHDYTPVLHMTIQMNLEDVTYTLATNKDNIRTALRACAINQPRKLKGQANYSVHDAQGVFPEVSPAMFAALPVQGVDQHPINEIIESVQASV